MDARRLLRRLLFLAWPALAPLGGCVRVDGGAVEVSWVVHSVDGQAINDCRCADPAIESVRIELRSVDDSGEPCQGRAECRFACGKQTGATSFDIPPGHYAVSIVAVDQAGNDLAQVGAPAPILREVVRGQVLEAEAFLLVAQCAQNCLGTNKSGVCTRQ